MQGSVSGEWARARCRGRLSDWHKRAGPLLELCYGPRPNERATLSGEIRYH